MMKFNLYLHDRDGLTAALGKQEEIEGKKERNFWPPVNRPAESPPAPIKLEEILLIINHCR